MKDCDNNLLKETLDQYILPCVTFDHAESMLPLKNLENDISDYLRTWWLVKIVTEWFWFPCFNFRQCGKVSLTAVLNCKLFGDNSTMTVELLENVTSWSDSKVRFISTKRIWQSSERASCGTSREMSVPIISNVPPFFVIVFEASKLTFFDLAFSVIRAK